MPVRSICRFHKRFGILGRTGLTELVGVCKHRVWPPARLARRKRGDDDASADGITFHEIALFRYTEFLCALDGRRPMKVAHLPGIRSGARAAGCERAAPVPGGCNRCPASGTVRRPTVSSNDCTGRYRHNNLCQSGNDPRFAPKTVRRLRTLATLAFSVSVHRNITRPPDWDPTGHAPVPVDRHLYAPSTLPVNSRNGAIELAVFMVKRHGAHAATVFKTGRTLVVRSP